MRSGADKNSRVVQLRIFELPVAQFAGRPRDYGALAIKVDEEN
jgi:hypothetical protein